jgi:hypothetical protein
LTGVYRPYLRAWLFGRDARLAVTVDNVHDARWDAGLADQFAEPANFTCAALPVRYAVYM